MVNQTEYWSAEKRGQGTTESRLKNNLNKFLKQDERFLRDIISKFNKEHNRNIRFIGSPECLSIEPVYLSLTPSNPEYSDKATIDVNIDYLFTPMEGESSNEKYTYNALVKIMFIAGKDDKDGMGLEFIEVKRYSFSDN